MYHILLHYAVLIPCVSFGLLTPFFINSGQKQPVKGKRIGTSTITKKPKPNITDAAHKGDLSVVKEALDNGENIDEGRGYCGTTLLDAAMEGGQLHVVKFLIARGATIDSKHLIYATYLRHAHIVEFLLPKCYASVNEQFDGELEGPLGCQSTALHVASFYDVPAIVKMLLWLKPNKMITNDYEKTASDVAANHQIKNLIDHPNSHMPTQESIDLFNRLILKGSQNKVELVYMPSKFQNFDINFTYL